MFQAGPSYEGFPTLLYRKILVNTCEACRYNVYYINDLRTSCSSSRIYIVTEWLPWQRCFVLAKGLIRRLHDTWHSPRVDLNSRRSKFQPQICLMEILWRNRPRVDSNSRRPHVKPPSSWMNGARHYTDLMSWDVNVIDGWCSKLAPLTRAFPLFCIVRYWWTPVKHAVTTCII